MSRTFIILALMLASLNVFSQSFEPEWVGDVNVLEIGNDNDTIAIKTEKSIPRIKTTDSAGLILFGIGNVRKKAVIKNGRAATQIIPNETVTLVVRGKDNDSDPAGFIQLVKFEEKKKERKTELAKMNWLGNVSEGNSEYIPFEGKRYGKSSYILTFPTVEGEYGVRVLNPNERDEKAPVFYCFGIHEPTY